MPSAVKFTLARRVPCRAAPPSGVATGVRLWSVCSTASVSGLDSGCCSTSGAQPIQKNIAVRLIIARMVTPTGRLMRRRFGRNATTRASLKSRPKRRFLALECLSRCVRFSRGVDGADTDPKTAPEVSHERRYPSPVPTRPCFSAVERWGQRLPDPLTLFAVMAAIVVVASGIFGHERRGRPAHG